MDLKIGDKVTGVDNEQWMYEGLAKIVRISGNYATLEIIKLAKDHQIGNPKPGETDGGWKLEWLKKVKDEQLENNIEQSNEDLKKNVKFKVGDPVKVINDIGARSVSVGDIASIFKVNADNYLIKMDKNGDIWYATDENLRAVFEIGDKVKIPKTKSTYGKIESSNVIRRAKNINQDYLYIVDKEDEKFILNEDEFDWSGDYFLEEDLELYRENEIENLSAEMEEKGMKNTDKFRIKVEIEDGKTTVKFKDGQVGVSRCHPEDPYQEYEGIRIALARAYGIDPFENSESKYEIGQIVDPETAKEIVENGGKVKRENGYIYYKEDGALVFDGRGMKANKSGGYGSNFTCDFEIVELPNKENIQELQYEIGQNVSYKEACEIINNGGRIKMVSDDSVYFMKDGKLMYIFIGIECKSKGFTALEDKDLVIEQLPNEQSTIYKTLSDYSNKELLDELKKRMS